MLCALASASSCVGPAYDLNRTDPAVTLGGDDLTFPLGTTRQLKVGDMITDRFGSLFVREDDGTFTAHYTADPVDFVFAGLKDYDGARPFRKYCNFPISTAFSLFRTPASGVSFDPDGTADLSGLLPATINLGTKSRGTTLNIPRMPDQLLGLESITLTRESIVRVTFAIPNCVLTDGTVTATVNVDLSQFFESEDCVDGILTVVVPLTKENGYSSTIDIPLRTLKFSSGDYDVKTHTLNLEARLGFNGSVSVSGARTSRARYESIVSSNPLQQLQVTAELRDLTCESIRGRYDYKIAQLQTSVDLTNLTGQVLDRIGDKDAVFDFDDPEIILNVESNISVPTYALVKLTALKKRTKVAVMDSIVVPFPIAEPGETLHKQIRLAKTAKSPEDVVLDFTELVRIAPDQIVVDIEGLTYHDQTGEVRVGLVYQAHVTPRVNIPLAFGPALQLTMRDTLTLPDTFGDLLQDNRLTLLGEMTNTLPLQLEFNMEMTDAAGNRLLEPVDATIAAGGTSPLSVPLAPLADAPVGKLSKAFLTFKVKGTKDNRPVKADDYIQAALRVKVPGGYHLSLQNDDAQ